MNQTDEFLQTLLWIVLVVLAVIGLCSILEKFGANQAALAWENRPRIGFQPNPESPKDLTV